MPDREAATHYFRLAFEQGVDGAAVALAKLYLEQPKSEDKGVKILKAEVDRNSNAAAHALAHYYSDKKMFKESDHFFERSYALGRKSATLCYATEIFNHGRVDSKGKALDLFTQSLDIVRKSGIPTKLQYAAILLWNDRLEEAQAIVKEQVMALPEIVEKKLDKEIGFALGAVTQYFSLLIAKGLTKIANAYFADDEVIDLKQIIKPVYFALMHYMKKDYPSEFLKAGNELKDTVQEIMAEVEQLKKQV
jgi:tetratricopeptide (TPR) repeat protein